MGDIQVLKIYRVRIDGHHSKPYYLTIHPDGTLNWEHLGKMGSLPVSINQVVEYCHNPAWKLEYLEVMGDGY